MNTITTDIDDYLPKQMYFYYNQTYNFKTIIFLRSFGVWGWATPGSAQGITPGRVGGGIYGARNVVGLCTRQAVHHLAPIF